MFLGGFREKKEKIIEKKKREYAGHAWNDNIFRREGNEVREVCADIFVFVMFHELGGDGFH